MPRTSELIITKEMTLFVRQYKQDRLDPQRIGLDSLPYTEDFTTFHKRFQKQFGKISENGFWRILTRIRKAGGLKQ